jgi:hypothetical protein
VCVYVCMCVCVCAMCQIHICIHTHTHAHIHTQTHRGGFDYRRAVAAETSHGNCQRDAWYALAVCCAMAMCGYCLDTRGMSQYSLSTTLYTLHYTTLHYTTLHLHTALNYTLHTTHYTTHYTLHYTLHTTLHTTLYYTLHTTQPLSSPVCVGSTSTTTTSRRLRTCRAGK